MSVRIGIAIGRGAVRAVALRAEKIVWAGEAPLASIDALQASITTLLAQAPATRWSRPVLHAAIGPHGAQVKRVVGLPEIGDVEALTAIVREAAGTYFLKNGIPLVTTRVRLAGAGSAVAAAVDRPYVEAIRAACQAKGYRAGPIAPTAIALLGALTDESFRWNDGSLTIDISRTGRQLDTVRTRPATSADDDAVTAAPVPALAVLGTDALRYADAFGAATVDAHEPLAIQSDAVPLWKVGIRGRRWTRPAAILALGALAIGISPLAAKWAGNRALANVARLRPGRWQVITTSLGQLDRVSTILSQARAFDDSRTSAAKLLGELSRVLPQKSALLSFDWSDAGGEISVVTDDPSGVLAAVRRIPVIGSVELVGSVTRQAVGGEELQRITVRFARKR
jgi:hypothetical protein